MQPWSEHVRYESPSASADFSRTPRNRVACGKFPIIARQPAFIVTVLAAGLGYGTMNLLMALRIALAHSGISPMHIWRALFRPGVGWNFLNIGDTTLLTKVYRFEERVKVQGTNDFLAFGVQAVSAVSVGALVLGGGWMPLNLYAIPAVVVIVIAVALRIIQR